MPAPGGLWFDLAFVRFVQRTREVLRLFLNLILKHAGNILSNSVCYKELLGMDIIFPRKNFLIASLKKLNIEYS